MPLVQWDEPTDTIASLVHRRARLRPADVLESTRDETPIEGVGLQEVLTGRRSVRSFAASRPGATKVTDVLRLADRSQRSQWPRHTCGDADLRILLAAYRVDGVASGLYAWEKRPGSLRPLGCPPWLLELPSRYADAPALILVCGPIGRIDAGAYSGLLVRVGAHGYAVWLAARTHGMDASVYARPSVEPTNAVSDLDHGSCHLFTVAIGYAQDRESNVK